MDDGLNGDFTLVRNGKNYPTVLTHTASGLTTGLPYRFYVVAENYIGLSLTSSITTIYACKAPSGLDKPTQGTTTASSVELYWSAPSDDGGCSLTGFSILRDDGASGSFVEVHAAAVNGNPSLNSYTVTDLPTSPLGLSIKFKVKAYNIAGLSVTSYHRSIVIASVPVTPTSAPYSDSSVTSGTVIKILYSTPSSGGSIVTNYEV